MGFINQQTSLGSTILHVVPTSPVFSPVFIGCHHRCHHRSHLSRGPAFDLQLAFGHHPELKTSMDYGGRNPAPPKGTCWNPKNNRINCRFQLVQDFATIHSIYGKISGICGDFMGFRCEDLMIIRVYRDISWRYIHLHYLQQFTATSRWGPDNLLISESSLRITLIKMKKSW